MRAMGAKRTGMVETSTPPPAPPSPSAARRQRILLVTGMLGAGKTTALRELEDLGWESIDNFPVRLLDRLVGKDTEPFSLAIGFDCRTRGAGMRIDRPSNSQTSASPAQSIQTAPGPACLASAPPVTPPRNRPSDCVVL